LFLLFLNLYVTAIDNVQKISINKTNVFIALVKLVKTEHIANAKNENIRDIVLLIEVIVPKTFESIFFLKKNSKLLE
ncbi:hypothetical protein, partial [Borreliella valaisiana]|uniref:hypothetical protein n=1 Tax=Borreliella valaisiana TaxID=62088 RepID=UPI001B348E7A